MQHNSNVSHEHPLREFFVLIVGASVLLLALLYLSGLFVDQAVKFIDPALEEKLFSQFAELDSQPRTDQEMEIQRLMDALGTCVDIDYPVQLSLSESEELNAFAMPGGRVVLLSAMLKQLQSENGLAFVLAHELGHFKNRDHLRSMGRSAVFLAVSSMLTGANSGLSSFLTPVVSMEGASYSRSRESAADATALDALNCHYGHVGGATEFFAVMAAKGERSGWRLPHYFDSHPNAQQRIDDLRNLAKELEYAEKPSQVRELALIFKQAAAKQ